MAKNKVKDPNKLGFGRLMAFKSSDIVAAWINLIMLNYLSIYASDTLGVNLLTVSTLLLASKAVDAVTDMVAGVIVDNTHTKFGKGRPYELSIIGMTICTILLFAGNPAWSNVVKCAWIFCMYTLTFSIFATLPLHHPHFLQQSRAAKESFQLRRHYHDGRFHRDEYPFPDPDGQDGHERCRLDPHGRHHHDSRHRHRLGALYLLQGGSRR